METVIETHGLRKTYDVGDSTIHALDGVSFNVQRGEMVAIVGASGSGKSTLMHILGCLDIPDEGEYRLDGENVTHMSDDELARVRNQKIGFVFQTFNLLSRTSALENVELPLLYGGKSRAQAHSRAAEMLKLVGLGDRMHHEPNQLSGGQRQRVAVARALVTDPAILLADEPTGNLDSHTSDDIMQLFESLHQSGHTIIVVTHEPDIAQRCPRHVTIKDGRILGGEGGDGRQGKA